MDKYIEISEEEAKELYCKGDKVYITNRMKTMWKMPATYEFNSLVPAEQLFYRLLSSGGNETKFYKLVKVR